MEHRRPALPPQRYSSSGESTGNAQPQNIAALALCHQGPLALTPPVQHIPTPPILPTQSVTSAYGTSLRARRSFHRDVSLRDSSMAHSRGGRNPIYAWKHFHDYRTKVAQKEREGDDPKWPMYLEDAFLDGPGEIVPVGKDREKGPDRPAHPKYRTRKQVSSHIQVLKGFFTTLPVFHFFFPRKNDEKDEDRRPLKEEEGETKSFKNNRVLIALTEGRLPEERPNYSYFGRLLAADSEVFLRPKTCHIYTSHSELTLSEDCRKAFTADGTCLNADAYGPDGTRLESQGDFPHLEKNSNKNTKRDVHRGGRDEPRTYLLHEYTESLTQTESSSVRDISSKWDQRFPDLRDKLMTALDDTHPSHEQTARCVMGPCDIIHMEVVLDLHGTSQFPVGTNLDGRVEFNISPSGVVSRRGRASFWDHMDTCRPSRRGNARDTIEVDFPATSWANIFCRLAKYVSAERERKQGERGSEPKTKREGGGSSKGSKLPTPFDMLEQIAMYQEIWSAPNDGSRDPNWTRRSVVLWTFSNVRAKVEETKGKQSKDQSRVAAGTTWRFLSKLDPMSQYHQQRAYLPGTPNVSRDSIMSPDPGYQHHLGAVMHENFGSTYDVTSLALPSHHQQQHAHLASINMIDGFANGLATPPPTACLPSNSYASQSSCFDTATIASTDSLQLHLSFTASDGSADAGGAADPTTDSFLSGIGVPGLDAPHWATTSFGGSQRHNSLGGWSMSADDMASIDSHAWNSAASQQQHHDGSRDSTPWHEGKDTLWATQGSSIQQGGLAVPSSGTLHTDTWAAASGSTSHDQQQSWAIPQQQQQQTLTDEVGRPMSIRSMSSTGTTSNSLWDEEHLGSQLETQQDDQQQFHHTFSSSGTPTVTIKDEDQQQQQSRQHNDIYAPLDQRQHDILTATRGRKRTREPDDDGSSTCSGSGGSSHGVGYGGSSNNNEYNEDGSNGYAMHPSMRRKLVHRPAAGVTVEDGDHHHHHQNAPLPPFMS
ncbi:Conidiophore development regulator abaA [Apiospora hydei]|uniref:Conidiophore development regulator abaA n=1 Tax=Apiospora hydei TaxID=1337664 RepID=A0ABR1VWV4_9PEZI